MENKKPFQLDQVAIRMVEMPPLYSEVPLNGPAAVIKVMVDTFKDYDREVFAIVNLRTDLKPINMNIVSIGALNQSLAHPREAIKSMVLSNAASVLLVHNHVTGKMEPSREDIALTDRLSNICNLMGIELMDHVIVGPGDSYFSFHERGEMPVPKLSLATNMEDLQFGGMKVAETATYEKTKKMIVSYTVSECGEFHNLGELHEGVKTIKEAIELFKKIPPERMNGIPAIGVRVTDPESPELFSEIDVLSGKRIDVDVLSYVPEIRDDWQAQQGIAELIHVFPDKEIIGEVPEGIQKKLQIIESREKQAEQLNGIMDQLEQGVQDVFNSGKYQQYLDTMAKFPRYSVNNSLLIMMQKPDAQMCQSFTGWKQMGRFVKKGEKGIKILAPAPYTVQRERNKVDEQTGKPVFDKDGEPVTETVEIKITGFKVVSTFDLSQTDGKELPSLGVSELQGSIENYGMMFAALKEICPVPITFEHIDSGAKGYYHTVENRIAIQDGMSEVQTLKTAIHEMAHQKLHSVIKAEVMDPESRSQKEVEAESVAYVVCQHFGINTSDYSFGYVAGWSEGKETPELKASLNTIRLAASDMISGIENVMEQNLQVAKDAEKQFADNLFETPKQEEKKKPSVKEKIKEEQAKEKKPARKPKAAKTKEERA